jgi:hypothetical protein
LFEVTVEFDNPFHWSIILMEVCNLCIVLNCFLKILSEWPLVAVDGTSIYKLIQLISCVNAQTFISCDMSIRMSKPSWEEETNTRLWWGVFKSQWLTFWPEEKVQRYKGTK